MGLGFAGPEKGRIKAPVLHATLADTADILTSPKTGASASNHAADALEGARLGRSSPRSPPRSPPSLPLCSPPAVPPSLLQSL